MSLKNKTLLVVIPLIILSSLFYTLFQIHFQNLSQQERQSNFEKETRSVYQHYLDEMLNHHYTFRLMEVMQHEETRKAFIDQDREALYDAAKHCWDILRKENPSLRLMHFHRLDGTSLLRIHQPGDYDDDMSSKRESLVKIHKTHESLYGCEMGKNGLYYRVMVPVFDKKECVGSLEIGFDISYLSSALHHRLGLKSAVFVNKKEYLKTGNLSQRNIQIKDYFLWGPKESETYFKNIGSHYDFQNKFALKINKSHFIAYNFPLPGLTEAFDGKLIFLQDITQLKSNQKKFVYQAIGTTVLIILLMIAALEVILRPLLGKMEIINKKLDQKIKQVTLLSITDSLTKVFNRQKMDEVLKKEIQRNNRYNIPFSLVMIDLDHFKVVNDTHGHDAGDLVLIDMCALVLKQIRENDIFARWGGEEFVLLLSSQSLEKALQKAEELRKLIETHEFQIASKVTASFGVTQFRQLESEAELLKRVDNNLYAAKNKGRNCIVAV